MPIRRTLCALWLAAFLAACAGPSPDTSFPTFASAAASALVQPGRPYDAEGLLGAMRESRRPGGVPDRVETVEVAEALAAQIWTWDGRPWDIVAIGGACAPDVCSIDIVGSRDGAAGTDLYSFEVSADGSVTLVTTDLHAYDASLDAVLDAAARDAAGDRVAGLTYLGASWLPPPETGVYRLAYRTGGEEGAPGLDLLLDLPTRQVVGSEPI